MAKDWKDLPDVAAPKKDWRALPDAPPTPESEESRLAAKTKASGSPLSALVATGKEIGKNATARANDANEITNETPGNLARAALAGVTSNAAPHILARMEGVRGALTPGESYQGEVDKSLPEYKEKYAQAVEDHPVANILGAIAQPNPLSKLKAGSMLGKLALSGGRVVYAGANGKVAHELGKTGDSIPVLGEGGQTLPQAKDGEDGLFDGAKAPMAVQAAAEVASPALGALASKLRDVARSRSLATLSPSKADYAKLSQLGIADKVADDLYKSGAVGPFSNTSDVSTRIAPIVQSRGSKLGDYIKQIDAATGGTTTQPSVAADRIRQMSSEQFDPSPAFRNKSVLANREADQIAKQYGAGTMSLEDSENVLKRGYDAEAIKRIAAESKGAAPSPKTDALALVRDAIKRQNEDAAEAAAGALAPELKGQFVPLKQGYGRMAEAQRIADKTGAPKAANRVLSPSDYGFGIASGQTYGASPVVDAVTKPVGESLTGLAASILHNQVRTRGSALASHLAYPAADVADVLGAPLGRAVVKSPAGAAATGSALDRYFGGPQSTGSPDEWKQFESTPPNTQAHPRDTAPLGHPGAQVPRRAPPSGPQPATAAGSRPLGVDVEPLEPTITSRKSEPTVDVQALPPTSMITSHRSTPEEIARDEEARKKDRMMRLARFYGGATNDSLDELGVQR